ncbi:hypothetical protein [Burkholderia sp. Ac-20365]|uniref:hypothetical protein n=1 Tax=Burkholderia sp. Ac-20365 TaxID=2703897 RepID=UPI00197BE59E|nr:hypothetical protein [Burkholderia sp. Ac-20365]MBN3761125.1 hypothetical protein [Burkholderia sp. Ac-20365]
MEVSGATLRNSAGVPMALTGQLLDYLAARGRALARFAFGDWLATLSDTDLQHLVDLAGAQLGGNAAEGSTDDLGGVAWIGSEAEKNRNVVWTKRELSAVFQTITPRSPDELIELMWNVFRAASMEGYRRQEFMEIKGKIRIHPFPGDQTVLTDEGLAHGLSLKNSIH